MADRLRWLQTPVAVIAGVVCLTAASMALILEGRGPIALAPVAALVGSGGRLPRVDDRSCRAAHARRGPDPVRGQLAATRDPRNTRTGPAVDRGDDRHRLRPRRDETRRATSAAPTGSLRAGSRRALGRRFSSGLSHADAARVASEDRRGYGAFPFLIFYLAPVIYKTPRQRQMAAESPCRARRLPRADRPVRDGRPPRARLAEYILSPTYGIHQGRGRGPFADAVANGFGLYVCALASCVAVAQWRGRARLAAGMSRCSASSARC